MKYLLLVYSEENAWTEQERAECRDESAGLCHDLNRKGQYLAASPLQPVATATSVWVRNNKVVVTDGPFAETREQLGGYYLIDVEHLDQAIEIAGRIPPAAKGTIEIRPIMEMSSLPNREKRL